MLSRSEQELKWFFNPRKVSHWHGIVTNEVSGTGRRPRRKMVFWVNPTCFHSWDGFGYPPRLVVEDNLKNLLDSNRGLVVFLGREYRLPIIGGVQTIHDGDKYDESDLEKAYTWAVNKWMSAVKANGGGVIAKSHLGEKSEDELREELLETPIQAGEEEITVRFFEDEERGRKVEVFEMVHKTCVACGDGGAVERRQKWIFCKGEYCMVAWERAPREWLRE